MTRMWAVVAALIGGVMLIGAVGQATEGQEQVRRIEARSLLGAPLYAQEFPPQTKVRLEDDLAKANAEYQKNARALEAIVWLGRRTAYLGRYQDAVAIYGKGIEIHPQAPELYRHRGHRYISVREFDKAVADLAKAASLVKDQPDQLEPDGAPNPANQPRSTLQFNIYYHLGLAHYLKGDFEQALQAYHQCMAVSNNDDSVVATSDWLYMTLRRLGRTDEAGRVLQAIRPDMEILENAAYHKRLLMYKGLQRPESLLGTDESDDLTVATQGYGVGNWYLYNGQLARAKEIFEQVVAGTYWPAFGYIAAEADLARGLTPVARPR